MFYKIEVYSAEAKRWYLWRDDIRSADLNDEIGRASKLYGTYRVSED